jgi:hypothetical protein
MSGLTSMTLYTSDAAAPKLSLRGTTRPHRYETQDDGADQQQHESAGDKRPEVLRAKRRARHEWTVVVVRMSVKAHSRNGVFTFTITLANAQSCQVRHNQR